MDTDPARRRSKAGSLDSEPGELAELTAEIAALPEIAPRRAWLAESKWRLLRKFDELHAERPESANERESDG